MYILIHVCIGAKHGRDAHIHLDVIMHIYIHTYLDTYLNIQCVPNTLGTH